MMGWNDNWTSVLWRCWLGVRKGIQPVKIWLMRCWRGYLSGKRCESLRCGPVDATATPSSLTTTTTTIVLRPFVRDYPGESVPEWFILLVLTYPGCPGKKAVKWLCVCVSVYLDCMKALLWNNLLIVEKEKLNFCSLCCYLCDVNAVMWTLSKTLTC